MNSRCPIRTSDILIVVDIQNDFCSGGSLAVPGGEEIIPLVNRVARQFPHVILTQDWHPKGHLSFASSHAGMQPYQTVGLSYGPQMLWPDHCIQDTYGADFHPQLAVRGVELILRKGYNPGIDSYSVLYENDRTTPTGLSGYLKQRAIRRIFLAGLALDYCVRFSAEDACRDGFGVVVIRDACRSIAERSHSDACTSMSGLGVKLLAADELDTPG